MARLAAWMVGFASALGWIACLFVIGSWLGSSMQDYGYGWGIALVALGPIPLIVALALRRGDLSARPLRTAGGAGLATGGYLTLLLAGALFATPFLLLHPVGWIIVGSMFLIPVVVWPLMFRWMRPAPEDPSERARKREVIRFP